MRKLYLLIFAILWFSSGALAQQNWGGGVDDEPIHFGFTFQYVSAEYKIFKKNDWRKPFLDPKDSSLVKGALSSISSPVSQDLGLGFVANYRLGEHADLRFTPALVFSNRMLDYKYENPEEEYMQQKIVATMIDFPLGIKIKSDRRKNFRAYLIGGAKYSVDITSKKKTNDVGFILSEKLVKNTRNVLWYEAGIGFDLYFEFFKLSPEIKLANTFKSVLRPENHPYSRPLDRLFLRNFQFSLYFE